MLAALSIRGRCLLAAGAAAAVCALVLDERDLLRVAAFTAALPLLALALSGHGRMRLRARREVLPARLPVGSQATVRLHITGTGLPVGGLLADDVPRTLGPAPGFRLGESRRAVLEYSVRPQLRGIHQIGPLHTSIADPLGLSEYERDLAGRNRLVVVPEVVPLDGLPAGSGVGNTSRGSGRTRAGPGEDDSMVRQYRHGDDLRRVHWKSTARRDELMVRAEERPRHGGCTVLLDRRAAAHRGSGAGSSLEWAVSATASICAHLLALGQHLRLVTEDGQVLVDENGSSPERVLETLAAVHTSPRRELGCGRDPGAGQQLIAVLGATTTAGAAELTRLRPQETLSGALLLDVRGWSELASAGAAPDGTAAGLRATGWAVEVVNGPQNSLSTAWQRLCRNGIVHPTEVV